MLNYLCFLKYLINNIITIKKTVKSAKIYKMYISIISFARIKASGAPEEDISNKENIKSINILQK